MAVVTTLLANAPKNAPYILSQFAVPVILAPNGTVATNGKLTLATALPTTYSGGAWVRLPANAVVGGSAGLYWTVFGDTGLVGNNQVYANFVDAATAFTPYIPSTLVAAVGSNAAYTQTTAADITLANITVPGGAMGLNGKLRFEGQAGANNNANAKTQKVFLGASGILTTSALVSAVASRYLGVITNRGALNRQMLGGLTGATSNTPQNAGTGTNNIQTTEDTSADKALTFTGQLAVATDYLILEAATVEVLPS